MLIYGTERSIVFHGMPSQFIDIAATMRRYPALLSGLANRTHMSRLATAFDYASNDSLAASVVNTAIRNIYAEYSPSCPYFKRMEIGQVLAIRFPGHSCLSAWLRNLVDEISGYRDLPGGAAFDFLNQAMNVEVFPGSCHTYDHRDAEGAALSTMNDIAHELRLTTSYMEWLGEGTGSTSSAPSRPSRPRLTVEQKTKFNEAINGLVERIAAQRKRPATIVKKILQVEDLCLR